MSEQIIRAIEDTTATLTEQSSMRRAMRANGHGPRRTWRTVGCEPQQIRRSGFDPGRFHVLECARCSAQAGFRAVVGQPVEYHGNALAVTCPAGA